MSKYSFLFVSIISFDEYKINGICLLYLCTSFTPIVGKANIIPKESNIWVAIAIVHLQIWFVLNTFQQV